MATPTQTAGSTSKEGGEGFEPVSYQNVPDELLAPELRTDNPLRIWRRIDGVLRLR